MVGKEVMKNKSGQVTIFIIVGIIIVALSVLIYTFYPKIQSSLGIQESTPASYIQSCVEDKMKETVDLISVQGGSFDPELYTLYQDDKIEYLCYTEEYYFPCIVQQPMLKEHVESEIKEEISSTVDNCFNSLQESYVGKGYSVELRQGSKQIELLPNKVVATFNNSFTITKGDDVQNYDSFNVILNNNLYELVGIVSSIIEWETNLGEADTETYMAYYPWLKVEKILRSSGNKIYTLTDRNTGDKFRFAVLSQVWPAGYVNTQA